MPSKATEYYLYTTEDDGTTLNLRDVIEGYSKKEAVQSWVKGLPRQAEDFDRESKSPSFVNLDGTPFENADGMDVETLVYLSDIAKAVDTGDVSGIPAFVVSPKSSVFVQKPRIQTTVSVEFG